LTSRRILILRKRVGDVFVQSVGEVRFPTLGEHVRRTIEHENAIHYRGKAALAEDFGDPDFQTVGVAARASPVMRERGAVFIFQPPAQIGRQLD